MIEPAVRKDLHQPTVDALLADLDAADAVTRDTAIARLSLRGARAVPKLLLVAEVGDHPLTARVGALQALEAIGDARATAVARQAAFDADPAVALAGIAVLHRLATDGADQDALRALAEVALAVTRPQRVRLAALRAVQALGRGPFTPLAEALRKDADPAIALAATLPAPDAAADPMDRIAAAALALPDTPDALRLAIQSVEAHAPADALRQIIERVRVREGSEPPAARAAWMLVRGAAHAALALQGHRDALYDVRETIAASRAALPEGFVEAMARVGDAACLEALATAYAHAREDGARLDDPWLARLTDAFRAVARREGVTRRHALGKRISARWRDAGAVLWG